MAEPTNVHWVLQVQCGQWWTLCTEPDGRELLRPSYDVCNYGEANAYDSEQEAIDVAESQAWGEFRVERFET